MCDMRGYVSGWICEKWIDRSQEGVVCGKGAVLGVIVTLLGLGFAELIHEAGEADLGVVLGAFLSEHELVDLLYHLEVLLEYLALTHNAACDLPLDIVVLLHHVADFQLQTLHVLLLRLQQLLHRLAHPLLVRL